MQIDELINVRMFIGFHKKKDNGVRDVFPLTSPAPPRATFCVFSRAIFILPVRMSFFSQIQEDRRRKDEAVRCTFFFFSARAIVLLIQMNVGGMKSV